MISFFFGEEDFSLYIPFIIGTRQVFLHSEVSYQQSPRANSPVPHLLWKAFTSHSRFSLALCPLSIRLLSLSCFPHWSRGTRPGTGQKHYQLPTSPTLSSSSRFTNRIALSSSANASWISSANKRYPSSLTLSLSLSSVFVSLSILLSRVIPLASRPSDPPSHQRYYSRAHQAHHGSCFFVISFSLHFSSPAWHLMRYNDKVLYRNPPAIIRPTKI